MIWALACFEPFGGAASNSSERIHARLRSMGAGAGRVNYLDPLPVTFAGAWPRLEAELARRPEVRGVLTLGQAAGRSTIDLECAALNVVDAEVPDNDGVTPSRGPLGPGADVRWCPIPWIDFHTVHRCARSYSAGTFVCNALFYESLGWAAAAPNRLAGFVHLPLLTSQSAFASAVRMDDDAVVAALIDVLDFLVGQS